VEVMRGHCGPSTLTNLERACEFAPGVVRRLGAASAP
jgi:hypothetical protein